MMFKGWTDNYKNGAENLVVGTGIAVVGGLAMAAAVTAIGLPVLPAIFGPMEATHSAVGGIIAA